MWEILYECPFPGFAIVNFQQCPIDRLVSVWSEFVFYKNLWFWIWSMYTYKHLMSICTCMILACSYGNERRYLYPAPTVLPEDADLRHSTTRLPGPPIFPDANCTKQIIIYAKSKRQAYFTGSILPGNKDTSKDWCWSWYSLPCKEVCRHLGESAWSSVVSFNDAGKHRPGRRLLSCRILEVYGCHGNRHQTHG